MWGGAPWSPKAEPLMRCCGEAVSQKLNTCAYPTVNFVCNIREKVSRTAILTNANGNALPSSPGFATGSTSTKSVYACISHFQVKCHLPVCRHCRVLFIITVYIFSIAFSDRRIPMWHAVHRQFVSLSLIHI